MSTHKQRTANRANAKKSTGPKSENGKSVSRMNALKHGLTAKTNVIGDEDPEEFEALRADLLAKFQPNSAFGQELIDYLTSTLWSLRRVPKVRNGLIRRRQEYAQAEAKAARDRRYYKSLDEEATRRCEEVYENDPNLIHAARINGTWNQMYDELLEEVQAEAFEEEGSDITDDELSTAEVDRAREVGLLTIVTDPQTSEAIRKLGRYEAELINTIFRLLRLLEVDQKLAEVIDVQPTK
jgi:hypothetical protein